MKTSKKDLNDKIIEREEIIIRLKNEIAILKKERIMLEHSVIEAIRALETLVR